MPLKPFPLTKIGINCVLKATLMHYSENPLFWRAFWRPSWISALGPLFIFGNIVNVFWGHIRNLKKLVWFSPGGGAKGPPSSSPTVMFEQNTWMRLLIWHTHFQLIFCLQMLKILQIITCKNKEKGHLTLQMQYEHVELQIGITL